MTTTTPAAWPRLGNHVLARRHVIDGKVAVILFDMGSEEVLRIGEREWALVAAADGTRDIEGIVIAATRGGARVELDEARKFLASLEDRGLVVRIPEPEAKTSSPKTEETLPSPDLPVRPLPGYSLSCDRSGRCCRMYSTVLFALPEAERAAAVLPDRRIGPVSRTRAFLPVRGSIPGGAVAVVANNGACGYLDSDGACSIHRAAGADAKPKGCSVFPAMFIDDGEEVRVSIKTECACVLNSVNHSGGEPLVDPAITRSSQLDPVVVVTVLPDPISVTSERTEPRKVVVAWIRQWLDMPTPPDVARACWAMADALPSGLAAALEAWSGERAAPETAAVVPFVAALARRAAVRTRVDAQWRSEVDRVRRVGAWIAATAVTCKDPQLMAEVLQVPPIDADREAFFVRAAAFGYAVCDEDFGEVQCGLRDLAVKLWLARAMPTFVSEGVQDEEPLSALEAWLRAYGVWRYVLDAKTSTPVPSPNPRD
ncbi:MAG: YkgJ family cysteine cluster protein [Nannocystaceae bacterium]|nr:YkgJ family cysteine cluster protein [Nannocystaceae bacterium]